MGALAANQLDRRNRRLAVCCKAMCSAPVTAGSGTINVVRIGHMLEAYACGLVQASL